MDWAQIQEWAKITFWRKRDHRSTSAGATDAGLPVVLNSLGKLDVSLFGSFGAWTALPYVAGWVDFGSGFQVGQYRKIGDMVYLRGLCKRTSGVSLIIVTLPAEHRPPGDLLFDVISNDLPGRVDIYATG